MCNGRLSHIGKAQPTKSHSGLTGDTIVPVPCSHYSKNNDIKHLNAKFTAHSCVLILALFGQLVNDKVSDIPGVTTGRSLPL